MTSKVHGKTIGIIGDEHLVGLFGRVLVSQLRAAGALVIEDGRVGRRAADLLAPVPEAARPSSGLGRAGPEALTAVLGAQPDMLILVLKRDTELEQLKAIAKERGVKEVWFAQPSGANPDTEAMNVVSQLAGTPPPAPPAPPKTQLRPVRDRI